jgi:hypothetical protein
VLPDALLEILEAPRLGRSGKQNLVELLGCMPTNPPDHDSIIFGIPLQDGSRDELETLAYLDRNRNLALRGEPGLCELHAGKVPR